MGHNNMRELRFIHWNANGIKNHIDELEDLLLSQRIHVAMISETHLTANKKIKMKNYNMIRNDRPNGQAAGGTALLINNRLKFTELPVAQLLSLEASAIKIEAFENQDLIVVAVYNRPGNRIEPTDLKTILNTGLPTIAAGDLNCKHMDWGCNSSNPNGNILRKALEDENWMLHAPDGPTHLPMQINHTPDILDIALTNNVLLGMEQLVLNRLNSDHLPVLLKLRGNTLNDISKSRTSLNWSRLKESIGNIDISIPRTATIQSIDNHTASITEHIQIKIKSCEETKIIKGNKSEISEVTRDLIKIRNRIRKEYQRTFNPALKVEINALQREIKHSIREQKKRNWEDFTENLVSTDNSLWRVAKKLKGSDFLMPPLTTDSGVATSDEEKAEAIADSLEQQFTPHPTTDQARVDNIEAEVRNYLSNPPREEIPPTDIDEVKQIIHDLASNKAPGSDGVTNKVIKILPDNLILHIVWIFNACLNISYFPTAWKSANIISVPKAGKNLRLPNSYRPISLLPTLGKMLEKILLNRIMPIVERSHLLPDEQFGFRPGHDTTLQVLRLVEKIAAGFASRCDTAVVLMDVGRAFDSIWLEGLIYKLAKILPDAYVHLVWSFLQSRNFCCKVNGKQSSARLQRAGTPQGALLSPTLYALYTRDIPLMDGVMVSTYADDTAVTFTSENPTQLQDTLQRYLDSLLEWAEAWRIRYNPEKTEAVYCTQRRAIPRLQLTLGNAEIAWKSSAKYLGIYIDRRLTWKTHIEKACNKGKAALNLLSSLLCGRSKLPLESKRLLYTAIIRPAIMYGCEIWGSAAQTNLAQIQTTQNKVLRVITDAPFYVRNSILHADLQIEPIKTEVIDRARKLYERAAVSTNPQVSNLGRQNPLQVRKSPQLIISDQYLQQWQY